ncbi:MAG TPA: AraC family transcriptional regulator [Sphingobium sp.]|uniref:helix-turn-helix domain-containing protein n=1 Tax=Sphingobium sp. TaxID=1912891 RepID=UPI002ED1486C
MTGHASQSVRDSGGVTVRKAPSAQRARLAPWQVKTAQTAMEVQIRGRLKIAEVAAILHLSVTHFAKAFKNSVGVSPYDWYQRARIARSIQLLGDTASSIAEIAVECGFTDESHFITSFSRAVGMTPGRWRRKEQRGPVMAVRELGISCS